MRRSLNLKGLRAMDLRTTRDEGTPWDFNKRQHHHDARRLQSKDKPTWMIGSPPCTTFSIWNVDINLKKMDPSRVAAMIAEGKSHLRFCAERYRKQVNASRHLLHEHPASAVSWREPYINASAEDHKVFTALCDQCQFGLMTNSADGSSKKLAMKPTSFLTSSQPMAEGEGKRCDQSHKHQHLVGA